MKTGRLLLTIILMVIGIAVSAQDNGDFVVPFSDPSKPGKIYVDIKTGSVTIKGTARKDVSVKYSKNDNDNNKDDDDDDEKRGNVNVNINVNVSGNNGNKSKEGLKKISGGAMDLEASEYQNTVKIVSDNWGEGVNLIIEVPTNIEVKAKAYNDGEVEISNITGNLELINYNGGITALGISGTVIAQTYNGDIKVVFDKLTADTPLSFINYNGDIDLTFPASLKATLKMKTKQGEIYTGFDGTVQKSNPITKSDSKSGANKIVIDDWAKMDVSGGGAEITMKSYNGDIYVRKK
jgi:Putative adhesin